MTTQNTLMPCPFCSGTDINIEEGKTYRISCADCFGNIVSFASKDDLINDWNARASQSQPCAEVVEALKTAAKTFRWYEEMHRTKPDHEKADRNAAFAEQMEQALALLEKNRVGG